MIVLGKRIVEGIGVNLEILTMNFLSLLNAILSHKLFIIFKFHTLIKFASERNG